MSVNLDGQSVRRHAETQLRAGRYRDALVVLEDHLQRQPADRAARYLLGMAAAGLGDTDTAVAAFSRNVRDNPQDARSQYGLGVGLRRQGRLQDAARVLETALSVDPQLDHARHELTEVRAEIEASTYRTPTAARSPRPGRQTQLETTLPEPVLYWGERVLAIIVLVFLAVVFLAGFGVLPLK
jgi:tetratricopeptide (TPR) repeat protein